MQQDTTDGPPILRVVQLAVEAFNRAGGLEVDGKHLPVVLFVEDPLGKPEEAARTALRLINQKGVFALVGPSRSLTAIPVSEVADNARIPMISPASTSAAITAGKPFAFRVTYTDPVQGTGIAHFARETLGATTAAVLYDETSSYSRDLAEAFHASFREEGGEISAFAGYPEDGWEEALQEIRQHAQDVLYIPTFENVTVLQAERARALGITATFLGSDSWPQDDLSKVAVFDGSYQAVPWHLSAGGRNQQTQDLLTAFQQTWGEPLPGYVSCALAYDATNILLEALRQAGRPDPEAVRDALSNIADYPGITGSITFRGTDGDPEKQGLVLQLRDGEVHFVQHLPTAQTRSGQKE